MPTPKQKPNILYKVARKLRKEATLPERLLWNAIKKSRDLGLVFRRQYPFDKYIFDFYCAKAKLDIEIDGQYHSFKEQIEKDKMRDDFLISKGFKVLRIPASEILKNPPEVAENIRQYTLNLVKD